MKKQYAVVLVVILVVSGILYKEQKDNYPVYTGEDILGNEYPYTFVFFGDNRPADGKEQPEVFKTIVGMINNDDPLFVIGGGDFVIEGTPENFEAFLSTASFDIPFFHVCGNHDDSKYYEHYLGERVYAFTYKDSIFIVLDSSKKVLDEKQLTFLEKQLKKDYKNTFVFLHVPPFDPEGTYSMINPEKFMDIVLSYKVDYVFCSHIHAFYEEKIGDTTFIISGGAGAPLRRGGYNHYLIMEVGDTITYTVVKV